MAVNEHDPQDLSKFFSDFGLLTACTDVLLLEQRANMDGLLLAENLFNKLYSQSVLLGSSDRESHPKQEGFSEHLDEDDLDFFRNLRVTKHTFSLLLDILKEKYDNIYRGGASPVSPKLCLQLGLWYLGNKATYREIAELFGMSESAVFSSVQNMITIICSEGHRYIKWPTGNAVYETEKKFTNMVGFPGVLGAVDGCHIEIKAPGSVQADYIDRTNRHSVNLMAVCDRERKFTFIDVGFPGSAHDSRVFKCSSLHQLMVTSPRMLFPSPMFHIIGDSAFQLSAHLLVPFKDHGNLSEQNRKYNTKLSQTRCVIENAFAFLKGRFRRLKYIDADIKRIPSIIRACCILHNVTLQNPEEENFLITEGNIAHEISDYENEAVHLPDAGGISKRQLIASYL